VTPRPAPRPPSPKAGAGWLELDFAAPRSAEKRPAPAAPPAGLREAIVRWLEQEL
jgi:hypothetical protein